MRMVKNHPMIDLDDLAIGGQISIIEFLGNSGNFSKLIVWSS
jgi:hypothetical protein